MSKQNLKLYWWAKTENGKKNFGDWLSPVLCEAISGKKVVYADPSQCDLVAIGSILQKTKNHFWSRRIHVWGSGLIEKKAKFRSPHYFHAVRGELTAKTISNKKIQTLGDPGLLCDLLLPPSKKDKFFKLGIIPHYVDKEHPLLTELSKYKHVCIIDIFSEITDFLMQVSRCDFILSSSLHGLIVADALKIPNGWIKLSQQVRGDDFKFADYYSVFGLTAIKPYPIHAATTTAEVESWCAPYQRPGLDQIKQRLHEAFPFR